MEKEFFEGADFKDGEFRALISQYYPEKYKKYIQEETNLLKTRLKGARVLEAGVGIGRLIPDLSPIVKKFVGIDNAELMLKKSKEIAKGFSNVKIVKGDLEHLSSLFSPNYFDYSLCVWNTLGNVKDEAEVLNEMSKVTSKSIFVTVFNKGTIKDRLGFYNSVGINISSIDEKNEIFHFKAGLTSKAYSLGDIKRISALSRLKVKDSKILAGVILWVELTK